MLFSPDAGATWKDLTELRNKYLVYTTKSHSAGCPSRASRSGTLNGNDQWPFIINLSSQGVYAISAAGLVAVVDDQPGTMVIGQDRTRTRSCGSGRRGGRQLDINAPGGNPKFSSRSVPEYSSLSGWITADGASYIQIRHGLGRFLFSTGTTRRSPSPGSTTRPLRRRPVVALHVVVGEVRSSPCPTYDFEGAVAPAAETRADLSVAAYPYPRASAMWSDAAGPEAGGADPRQLGQLAVDPGPSRSFRRDAARVD